jgi:hypothetical protein
LLTAKTLGDLFLYKSASLPDVAQRTFFRDQFLGARLDATLL